MAEESLRERREAVVREHMESENTQDFDVTLATFAHPRYELMATGQVYDGHDEVSRYYAASRAVFPDQRNELRALHHSDEAVIVEFDRLGTHKASGREFRSPMVALFFFEGDRIVNERVYYDQASIQRQLGLPAS
ncbi:MAG: nuclear transport factor 2 family protein [Dehalococcoidia bacterium]